MSNGFTSLLQALNQGAQGALEGYQYGQQLQRQAAQDAMQTKLHEAQLAQYQRQAEQQKYERERQGRQDQANTLATALDWRQKGIPLDVTKGYLDSLGVQAPSYAVTETKQVPVTKPTGRMVPALGPTLPGKTLAPVAETKTFNAPLTTTRQASVLEMIQPTRTYKEVGSQYGTVGPDGVFKPTGTIQPKPMTPLEAAELAETKRYHQAQIAAKREGDQLTYKAAIQRLGASEQKAQDLSLTMVRIEDAIKTRFGDPMLYARDPQKVAEVARFRTAAYKKYGIPDIVIPEVVEAGGGTASTQQGFQWPWQGGATPSPAPSATPDPIAESIKNLKLKR